MIMSFGDVITILKGKVVNPFISSKQKLKILDALRRQLDFVRPNTTHNPNTWWDEFMDLNNELKALAMSDDDEYKTSMIGVGTTYYYQNFYIGGGIIKQSSESESGEWSYESSQQFMNFNGGYLHRLTESVFLDIGLQYLKGMGETETESNGDSLDDIDNEETYFSMNVGIRAFFSPKLPK